MSYNTQNAKIASITEKTLIVGIDVGRETHYTRAFDWRNSDPLPEDIRRLGEDGVNQIWRDIKLKGAGMKRAKTLISVAEHSVGSKEAPETARLELKNLLDDMDVYASRLWRNCC